MRLTVEGVTIEGQTKLDRNQDVDFELERQKCVAQNFVFRKTYTRIISCFFSIIENVAVIFEVYLSVASQNGRILRSTVLVGHELLYVM